MSTIKLVKVLASDNCVHQCVVSSLWLSSVYQWE